MHQSTSTVLRTETVIFDLGGVFTGSPLAAARNAARQRGVDAESLIDVMIGRYGEESDHPWQRVERGELPLQEARRWVLAETKRRLGVEIDPMEVMAPLMAEPPRESMVRLAQSLRGRGLTLGLLTNNARELRSEWASLLDWESLFDEIIDSSEVGVRKPDPAAFLLALERCGQVDPERALMVDDFEVNVEGARAIGMKAVLVGEDPQPAIAEIEEMVA